MNILFSTIFLLSTVLLLVLSPEEFLSALLSGSSRAATLCLSLVATYAVWLGLMQLWEDSGLSGKLSRVVKPVARKLFKTSNEETLDAVCMSLSVNMLGISGAATPYGIKSAKLLDRSPHAEYASAMFFVLNATSLQLIPTSIIGIRVALNSAAPTDIILPTLFTTVFSTLLGAVLVRLLIPPQPRAAIAKNKRVLRKTQGAGI